MAFKKADPSKFECSKFRVTIHDNPAFKPPRKVDPAYECWMNFEVGGLDIWTKAFSRLECETAVRAFRAAVNRSGRKRGKRIPNPFISKCAKTHKCGGCAVSFRCRDGCRFVGKSAAYCAECKAP